MEKVQVEAGKNLYKERNVDEAGLYELNYLNLVIKETLRLHPPDPPAPMLLPRECRGAFGKSF